MSRAREQRVVEAARRLLAKLLTEEDRGTPVHPAGSPECPWTLAGAGYPAEYAALADALDALDSERVRAGVLLPATGRPAPGGMPDTLSSEGGA